MNKATYNLVLVIFGFVKIFSKEYKYKIGESIKKETIKAITNVYRANSSQDKIIHLTKARENIEVIRLYVRLLKDLHQINVKQLVFVNGYIENVSKQLTGWLKSQKNLRQPFDRLRVTLLRVTLCSVLISISNLRGLVALPSEVSLTF